MSTVTGTGRRGMTLAECAVALVVSSVLLAAVYGVLLAGWRLARALAADIGVRQNVRAAAAVLRSELQGVSAPAGDLLRLSDSAVVLRATRGFGIVCAPPGAAGSLVVADSLFTAIRAVVPARDSALVFREGDPRTAGDDRWLAAAVTAVRGGSCSDGSSGTELVVSGPTAADLAGVVAGAPVRTFEVLEYRRYTDAAGLGWLGVRGLSTGGGWAATSPLAGPLRPRDGVVFRFFDARGSAVSVPANVALVEAEIHGLDPRRLSAPGRFAAPSADSITARVAVAGP